MGLGLVGPTRDNDNRRGDGDLAELRVGGGLLEPLEGRRRVADVRHEEVVVGALLLLRDGASALASSHDCVKITSSRFRRLRKCGRLRLWRSRR